MPPFKEIHYFDQIYIPENRPWCLGHVKKSIKKLLMRQTKDKKFNLNYCKYLVDLALVDTFTEEWYKACFNRRVAKGKALGDITPAYCALPDEGVEYVRKFLGPDLKIIYIIRNPVSRAISHLKMNLTRGGKNMEGAKVWIEEAKSPKIIHRGDYLTYIPRWEKYYSTENILYIPYNQVQEDPKGLVVQIEKHLGVPAFSGYNGLSEVIHKTKELPVPQEVVQYFSELLAPQAEFLKARFGESFYKLT